MYENIIDQILEKARPIAQASEVFLISSEETPVHFEANRLKSIRSRQSCSVALRIFKNGRIGYALSNNIEAVDILVADAVETAEFGALAEFEMPSTQHLAEVDTYDDSVPSVSLKTMVNLGETMVSHLTAHYPRLVCEGNINKEKIYVEIANSRGLKADYSKTIFELEIAGTLINGTDMLFVGDGCSSCHPVLDTKAMIQNTLRQIEWAQNQSGVTAKKMPVIFMPAGIASALIAPLEAGFNGKIVLEGASPIGNKLLQEIFDKKLSIYDDATLPYQPQSRPFDDEGIASRRLPLIEKGVVKNFFYDLKTAARAGKTSTGHAARSSSQPIPAPTAFVVSNGDSDFNAMLSGIDEGLIIENLMGAEQGNILGGDFSGNVLLGYKIEHGKIKGRVKDTVVSGNIYELLTDITALGNDGRWIGSGLYTPSILFQDVSVASHQ